VPGRRFSDFTDFMEMLHKFYGESLAQTPGLCSSNFKGSLPLTRRGPEATLSDGVSSMPAVGFAQSALWGDMSWPVHANVFKIK